MPDDIAYWKQERAKLQEQLNVLETEAVPKASLPLIRYLMTRIADLGPAHCIFGDEAKLNAQGQRRPEAWIGIKRTLTPGGESASGTSHGPVGGTGSGWDTLYRQQIICEDPATG